MPPALTVPPLRQVPVILAGLLLLAAGGGAEAASSKAGRLRSLVDARKLDKALELCDRLRQRHGRLEQDERPICAEADLLRMDAASTPPTIADLDAYVDRWAGLDTAREVRERAARARLEKARENPASVASRELLQTLVREYADTAAGDQALALLWSQAQTRRSVDLVEQFLEDYPDSPYTGRARMLLRDLAWEHAEAQGTSAAWLALVQQWPEHPQAGMARKRAAALAYDEAEQAGTVAAWEAFLEAWPEHPRTRDAHRLLLDARVTEAREQGPAALLAVVAEHPEHPQASLLRGEALRGIVQVRLALEGQPSLSSPLEEGRGSPEATLSAPVKGIDVRWEGLAEHVESLPEVELMFARGGNYARFLVGYSAGLRALGFDGARAQELATVTWEPDGQKGMGARPPAPLCDVSVPESWYAVVIHLPEQDLVYPFRVAVPCEP